MSTPFHLSRILAVVGWLLGLLLLYPATGYGAPLRYISRSWSVEQGLPHTRVNRVLQDPRGFLWVGTNAGLTRFDGISFTHFPTPHRGFTQVANIRDMAVLPDGSVLVLPATGGILQLRDGVYTAHPATQDLGDRSLLDLYVEPSGALWIGTSSAEVIRWQDGRMEVFGEKDGVLRRTNRITFATDRRGRTWVAAGDFLAYYTDGKLLPAPPALSNLGRSILVAPTRRGGLWIATTDQLVRFDDDTLEVCVRAEWPARRAGIECVFEDRHGNVWIGTRRNGLYSYTPDGFSRVEFDAHTIFSLFEDREGNLWAGTSEEGLCRLRSLSYTLLDSDAGMPEDLSTAVCEDKEGGIWCANRGGGLVRWKNGLFQRIGGSIRSARFAVRVAPDRDGRIWFAAEQAVFRLSPESPEAIETVDDTMRSPQLLFGARNGDVWVQSFSGFGYFRDSRYFPVNYPDGANTHRRLEALAEDAKGHVWAGVNDTRAYEVEVRLWEFVDGQLQERVSPERWPGGAVSALAFDHRGRLWAATTAGLVVKDGENLRCFGLADGLPDDLISQLLIDDLGNVWCGSRRGYFRISGAELEAVMAGRARRVRPKLYGLDDGLQGASALIGGQPRAWKASDGRLWFTSIRGVIGFDPASAEPPSAAPAVYVTGAQLDGKTVVIKGGAVEVPSEVRRLTFNLAALHFAAPEKVRILHKLEGFDEDWVDTPAERVAQYSHLPPGQYRLRVVASNSSGVWNESGAELGVTIAAAWWQKLWARVAGLVVLAGLVAWIARTIALRNISRRLKALQREHALERERARIARNLHDELGGSLTQIGLHAERLRRYASSEDLHRALGQLAWRTRSLAGDLESIVWAVSPQNDSWDRLASFIAQYTRRFLKDTGVTCTVAGVESIPPHPLSPEAQHEVLAVLKESLNNVLKHARAQNVAVEVGLDHDVFEIVIRDDGVGFEPDLSEHSERNGLANIRARGATLNGQAVINSRKGHGTEVRLRVPRSAGPDLKAI